MFLCMHHDGLRVWEATLQLSDKREEACHATRQTQTHKHTLPQPHRQPLLPRPPINPLSSTGSPHLLLPPPHPPPPTFSLKPPDSPAKLTAPSSVENESRSHYNRAGQIPLALSEIERGE